MLRFIAWRLLQFPLVLAVVYLITFFLVWVAPGDPFQRGDRRLDEATIAAIKLSMHAETWQSFLAYYPLNLIRSGDFGYSLSYEEWTVNDILASALPVSVALGLMALAIATAVGVGVGTLA